MKREIYLAGGCFWGVEHYMRKLLGVVDTQVGYANSRIENPSYEQVCTGDTGAVECVQVWYDDELCALSCLLKQFFLIIDPTTLNRQGEDTGTQYRSGIYYTDDQDLPIIRYELDVLQSRYFQKLVVEVLPLVNIFMAEEYHQDYLLNHAGGYCHVPIELFVMASHTRCSEEQILEDSRRRKDL